MDPNGENPIPALIAALGSTGPVGAIIAVAVLVGILIYSVSEVLKNPPSIRMDNIGNTFKNLIYSTALIEKVVNGTKTLVKTSFRNRRYEYHHIVPQTASACAEAQYIFNQVGIPIHSPSNLIILEYGTHRHLHTDLYYSHVNNVIKLAYNKDDSNFINRIRVEAALAELRLEIRMGIW